jgi:hypothetical protein
VEEKFGSNSPLKLGLSKVEDSLKRIKDQKQQLESRMAAIKSRLDSMKREVLGQWHVSQYN